MNHASCFLPVVPAAYAWMLVLGASALPLAGLAQPMSALPDVNSGQYAVRHNPFVFFDSVRLNLNYHLVATIDQAKCIGCELCYTACEDGAHQAIKRHARGNGKNVVEIIDEACVGCNLCSQVCPVDDCITMKEVPNEFAHTSWKQFTSGKGELAPRSDAHHTASWPSKH